MPYRYTPTKFNGSSLLGGNLFVGFQLPNSPAITRQFAPVEAAAIGLGDRDVRSQPKGGVWELHIWLTNTDQDDIEAFYKIFDEEAGRVFLEIIDGAGIAWQVLCRMVRLRRESYSYFVAVLRIADATWERVAETTTSRLAMSGDSDAFTVANDGNRKARPTSIAITANATKGDVGIIEDYKLSILGAIANRAPSGWNNEPVLLTSLSSGLDHAALVTGNVRALITEAGGIDSTQDTIAYDTGQNGNPPTKGMIMIDDEQIYYTGGGGFTASQLTGCVRGIGGTANVGHADNAEIKFSEGLANGDDIRVWLNQVEVDRWIDGANTGSLKVWINATMPARTVLTPDRNKVPIGFPPDGGTIKFREGVSSLSDSGFIIIGSEIITYKGRSSDLTSITEVERGAWGTTEANHSGVSAYRGDYLVVVSCGFAKAGDPPSPDSKRPCIQLKASLNNRWFWGDIADDAKTVFWDQSEPNRTAQWRPSVQQNELDKATALRMKESADFVSWETNDPIAGKPLVPRLTVSLPQGIEATADAINYDIQKRKDIRLRILGVDEAGLEVELVDSQDIAEALQGNQKITPDAVLHQLIYNGVRAYTTVQNTDESTVHILSGVTSFFYRMILDQDTAMKAIQLQLKKNGGGDSFTFTVGIRDNSGANPSAGIEVMSLDQTSGSGFTAADLTTAYVTYEFTATAGAGKLIAGIYWIEVRVTVHSTGSLRLPAGLPRTKNVNHYSTAAGDFLTSVTTWQLVHEGDQPVQPEATEANDSGNDAAFGDTDVLLNDAAADPMTPLVAIDAAFGTDYYHCVGNLVGTESGDSFDLDVWLQVPLGGATLTIDVLARTVTYTRGQERYSLPVVLIPSNLDDWQPLLPGTNNLTYTEKDMVDTDLVIKHRDAKV
ncbi:hypothetical protein LCGC14_0577640 [marine sediment metagenome]|uniref:Uncharacterized protein n=1 Tax=marine sediment metagenome TaxID=412755 RepID=A0A0F9U3R0_9ZZZZ